MSFHISPIQENRTLSFWLLEDAHFNVLGRPLGLLPLGRDQNTSGGVPEESVTDAQGTPPVKETYFHHLYLPFCPFGHDPYLMMTSVWEYRPTVYRGL